MKKVILILAGVFIAGCSKAPFDVMPVSSDYAAPKFINKDFVDINQIMEISKFRSSAGHDYSDSFESNRSMKHYYYYSEKYIGDTTAIKVYSPVNGLVILIGPEETDKDDDKQIHIKPEEYPEMTIVIFHVNRNINQGDKVVAGQHIGYTNMTTRYGGSIARGFDIAVRINTKQGGKLISYFDIMTDELFAIYHAKGISSRDMIIITKEWRDNNPANFSVRNESDYIRLQH